MFPDVVDLTQLIAGVRQVVRAAELGHLSKVYIAQDIDETLRLRVEQSCQAHDIPIETLGTKSELGAACRLGVGAAAVGLIKPE